MPLLRKQPFHRQKIPHDLRPEEEVFHCKITNEIFRDYNAFFERIILCNSLVWSCGVTGKSGMTYKEAEESEERAKKNLSNFQDCLKKPLLYLASLTHRSRLNDLNDDVFMYAKDRYFVGEPVEYINTNQQKKSCKVVEVIPPEQPAEKANGDVIVIEDDSDESNQGAAHESKKLSKKSDPSKYSYRIKLSGQADAIEVTAAQISRKRGLYSRDRSKLFLKQHCDPVDGLWKVKEPAMRKLGLKTASFSDYFAGEAPSFPKSQIKRKKNARPSMEEPKPYIEFEEPPPKVIKPDKPTKDPEVEVVPMLSYEERVQMREQLKQQKLEEREAKKEEMRQRIEAEKQKRKEERDKERMKKNEEKRKEAELLKERLRPRDDLECDDLEDMPEYIPVRTRVTPELFGDAVMILEFTQAFKSIFDFKQFFPKGFTWGMIESALMDHEPDGPLCDLLQMLLCALFNLQEEEAEEYQELEKEEKNVSKHDDDDVDEEISKDEMIKSATHMAQYSQNTLGMPLRDTLLDQFTLSEILRIHILSSGARASNKNARFRYQQRGGYTEHDDPGLHMKINHAHVVKALADVNVFDLAPEDKVKIIDTLLQQIMTYAMVRDMVEETSDKLRVKKYDLKQFQWAEQRREREEMATRYKKMMEERMKEQANRMQQLLAEQNGLPTDVTPLPDMVIKSPEEKEVEKQKEHEMETRKKSEFSKRETDLVDEILSMQKMVSICPIGRDRLFRRYYFFPTLKGVFIEDHELHVPADMLKPGLASADAGEKLKLLPQLTFQGEKKENGGDCIVISDDENGKPKSKSVNNVTNAVKDEEMKEEVKETEEEEKSQNGPLPKLSNGEVKRSDSQDTNPAEDSNSPLPPVLQDENEQEPKCLQNPTWSFIDTPEYLDALLACLNNRGFREGPLKVALSELKNILVKSIKGCQSDVLSLPEDGEEKARIQALALTRGISSKKAAQESLMEEKSEATMELNLRDALLDMEDRIHVGALGSLKIRDRGAWRSALLKGGYDPQSDDPQLDPSAKSRLNGGTDHNSSTNSDSECVARDLGRALVQIARGVELRFFTDPLREDESKKKKSKDKKKKDGGEDSDGEGAAKKPALTTYDRWEESLLTCSSLSQVYLHLASLDKSIVWAKSTLETRCRLCRRKGDAENMLLCDGCDRGHHMYCLKPPMEKVPRGKWFCPGCQPKQVARSPSRKGRRKTFTEVVEEPEVEEEEEPEEAEESMEEEEEEEEETMEEEEEEEEEEDEEEDDEEEEEEEENSEEEEEEMELEKNDLGEEVCTGCKTTGTLIICDCCPRAYHMECTKPVLKKVPKGKWMCQVCMGIEGVGKIKIGGPKPSKTQKSKESKVKTPLLSVSKGKGGKEKKTPTTSRPNSRPNSRQGSPRDSPVPRQSKKHPLSTLAAEEGQPKMKKSRSVSKVTDLTPNGSDSAVLRLINPSSKRSNTVQQQMKAAEELINEMMKHADSWPFLKPVDKKLVPDYYDVIKKPMDLGTIRNKIHKFSYKKCSELFDDVRKIFSNCAEYNAKTTVEYKACQSLSKYFTKRIKEKGLEEDGPPPSKGKISRLSL